MAATPPPSYNDATQAPYPTTTSPLFPQPIVTPTRTTNRSSNLNQQGYGFMVPPSQQPPVPLNAAQTTFPVRSSYVRNTTSSSSSGRRQIVAILAVLFFGAVIFFIIFFTVKKKHYERQLAFTEELENIRREQDVIRKNFEESWSNI